MVLVNIDLVARYTCSGRHAIIIEKSKKIKLPVTIKFFAHMHIYINLSYACTHTHTPLIRAHTHTVIHKVRKLWNTTYFSWELCLVPGLNLLSSWSEPPPSSKSLQPTIKKEGPLPIQHRCIIHSISLGGEGGAPWISPSLPPQARHHVGCISS